MGKSKNVKTKNAKSVTKEAPKAAKSDTKEEEKAVDPNPVNIGWDSHKLVVCRLG